MHPPYLSIVLTGRNDTYGGDFLGRFLKALRFNSEELSSRGVHHEWVLVEWSPKSDVPSLHSVIESELPQALAESVRSIEVPQAYHDALSQNPRLDFHEFMAKNVGIRRAKGDFVLTSNCDIVFGRRVLDALQGRVLQQGIVYRSARGDLKMSMASCVITWDILEDPANLQWPPRTLRPPYFALGSGDFILLDRGGWEHLKGFNEVYRASRIGIDRNLLTHALARGVQIADLGGLVYHFTHEGSFRLSSRAYDGREWEAPYGDRRWPAAVVVYDNPSSWGLADAPERVIDTRRTALDFSWAAVPPLVALRSLATGSIRPVQHRNRRPDPALR